MGSRPTLKIVRRMEVPPLSLRILVAVGFLSPPLLMGYQAHRIVSRTLGSYVRLVPQHSSFFGYPYGPRTAEDDECTKEMHSAEKGFVGSPHPDSSSSSRRQRMCIKAECLLEENYAAIHRERQLMCFKAECLSRVPSPARTWNLDSRSAQPKRPKRDNQLLFNTHGDPEHEDFRRKSRCTGSQTPPPH